MNRLSRFSFWLTSIASAQWLFFILANTIVVPLTVGAAFELSSDGITGLLRNSLIFTGIACMLQGVVGHRFPIMEGHSGVLWGVVLNLCLSAPSMGISLATVGGGIATGMLLAGVIVILLAAFDMLSFLPRLIKPQVMSVFLFLLTFQLIIIYFKGMLGKTEDGSLDIPRTLFALGIVVFVLVLHIKGRRAIGHFSLLIGMAAGWGLYSLLFPYGQSSAGVAAMFDITLFPLGMPNLNTGIVVVTLLACIVDLSNTFTTVRSVSGLFREYEIGARLKRSFLLNGFFNLCAATLGLVTYAPFASTLSFLKSTRIVDRKPFLIGGGLMMLFGLIPSMSHIIAKFPIIVGNAVLFVIYLQLLGTSLKSLEGKVFDSITIYRIAIPVLTGLGIMNVDADVFRDLPVLLQSLISNGLITGVLLSIMLEMFVKWDKGAEVEKELQ